MTWMPKQNCIIPFIFMFNMKWNNRAVEWLSKISRALENNSQKTYWADKDHFTNSVWSNVLICIKHEYTAINPPQGSSYREWACSTLHNNAYKTAHTKSVEWHFQTDNVSHSQVIYDKVEKKQQIKQANNRTVLKYLFQTTVISGACQDGMITHRRLILAG